MNKRYTLQRTASHRKALLRNLGKQLLLHKRLITTLAKAKALRPFIEPLLTKSKKDTTHHRRHIFAHFQDKQVTRTLFQDIAPRLAHRPGGYTRIIRLPRRAGDNAALALVELVDYTTKSHTQLQ